MKFLNDIDGAKRVKQDSENRFVTDAEKASWNSKGVIDIGTFDEVDELIGHIVTNQLPTGQYSSILFGTSYLMWLRDMGMSYSSMLLGSDGFFVSLEVGKDGELYYLDGVSLGGNNDEPTNYMPISGGVLGNYSERLTILNPSSGIIDLSLSNVFQHSPNTNIEYTITNLAFGSAKSFTLIITQTSTPRTLTFPEEVRWQGGEIPVLTTPGKTYVLTFMTVSGGYPWLGMFGGEF